MKNRVTAFLCAVMLSLVVKSAHAGYHYQFQFDAIGNYSSASFGFNTNSLLTNVGDFAPVSPSGDLNGYAVNQVTVNQRLGSSIAFTPNGDFFGSTAGSNAGDIVFFFFAIDNYTDSVGVFSTANLAGRDISFGNNQGSIYAYTSGSLTISEVNTNVPEPASITLLGLGLFGLAATRRRKN